MLPLASLGFPAPGQSQFGHFPHRDKVSLGVPTSLFVAAQMRKMS